MLHMHWDNGVKTCAPLGLVRKDINVSRVERCSQNVCAGALFRCCRSVRWHTKLRQGSDNATWSFYDSIGRHLQPRVPTARATPSEERSGAIAAAGEAEVSLPALLQEEKVPEGVVRLFEDGSIELETSAGTRWFRDFEELERVSKAHGNAPDVVDTEVLAGPSAAAGDVDYV